MIYTFSEYLKTYEHLGKDKTKKKISMRYLWNNAKVGFPGRNSILNKKFVKRSSIGYNKLKCLTLNVKLYTENHSTFNILLELKSVDLKLHCSKVI